MVSPKSQVPRRESMSTLAYPRLAFVRWRWRLRQRVRCHNSRLGAASTLPDTRYQLPYRLPISRPFPTTPRSDGGPGRTGRAATTFRRRRVSRSSRSAAAAPLAIGRWPFVVRLGPAGAPPGWSLGLAVRSFAPNPNTANRESHSDGRLSVSSFEIQIQIVPSRPNAKFRLGSRFSVSERAP